MAFRKQLPVRTIPKPVAILSPCIEPRQALARADAAKALGARLCIGSTTIETHQRDLIDIERLDNFIHPPRAALDLTNQWPCHFTTSALFASSIAVPSLTGTSQLHTDTNGKRQPTMI
ncbi:MAG: hypothetical protein APF80_07675 [Alphaproteobacteria bacterium BRH_c36]|nr:MAG: hypothetical protein APF80_07675 [Alphaproteobacteria bacterium BRH_c36]